MQLPVLPQLRDRILSRSCSSIIHILDNIDFSLPIMNTLSCIRILASSFFYFSTIGQNISKKSVILGQNKLSYGIVRTFAQQQMRSVYDTDQEKWFVSVIYTITVLTGNKPPQILERAKKRA